MNSSLVLLLLKSDLFGDNFLFTQLMVMLYAYKSEQLYKKIFIVRTHIYKQVEISDIKNSDFLEWDNYIRFPLLHGNTIKIIFDVCLHNNENFSK